MYRIKTLTGWGMRGEMLQAESLVDWIMDPWILFLTRHGQAPYITPTTAMTC